jgi:hypothetical protein
MFGTNEKIPLRQAYSRRQKDPQTSLNAQNGSASDHFIEVLCGFERTTIQKSNWHCEMAWNATATIAEAS